MSLDTSSFTPNLSPAIERKSVKRMPLRLASLCRSVTSSKIFLDD
jgi:hypothetical protein